MPVPVNNPDNINIKPISYVNSYLNSKGFRKRLANIRDDSIRKTYRENSINYGNADINIVRKDDSIYNKVLGVVSNRHKARTNPTSYDNRSNYITIGEFDDTHRKIAPDEDFVIAHEYGHKVDPTDKAVPFFFNPYTDRSKAPYEYRQIHNRKNVDKSNVHDKAYAETYADLMGTRYDLYKNNIYDSRGVVDFTEDDYNRYIEYLKKNNKHNRLIEQFDKNDFIELLNTVAQNNDNRVSLEDMYYG